MEKRCSHLVALALAALAIQRALPIALKCTLNLASQIPTSAFAAYLTERRDLHSCPNARMFLFSLNWYRMHTFIARIFLRNRKVSRLGSRSIHLHTTMTRSGTYTMPRILPLLLTACYDSRAPLINTVFAFELF